MQTDISLLGLFSFVVLIVGAIILGQSIKIVSQADVWIIERLGRYHRQISGGLNFIVPFIDTIRAKYSLQEQVIDVKPQKVITKDNVSITIDGVVFFRITNAQHATYGVSDLRQMVAQLAQTNLRSEIGKMDMDSTLSSREELNQSLLTVLDSAAESWGCKVVRVEISDIQVPPEVQRAMELQLQATRERRAIETRAEADKNAIIAEAEGNKEKVFKEAEAMERMAKAQRVQQEELAEGQKRAMELINEAMQNNPQAAEFLLAKDRIAAFAKLAESTSQNKIIIPSDLSATLGSLTAATTAIASVALTDHK